MGLLRSASSPPWHPANEALQAATQEAVKLVNSRGAKLEDVALGFGFSSAKLEGTEGRDTPTVIGLSTPEEVHETMKVYTEIYRSEGQSRKGRAPGTGLGEAAKKQRELEKEVVEIFKRTKTENWGWPVGV